MVLARILLHCVLLAALGFAPPAGAGAIQDSPGLDPSALAAVSPIPPLITGPVDEARRIVLAGNVHPLAQRRYDRGAVDDSLPAEHILLLLRRSDAQEAALRDFLQAAHTPGDPAYQKWLKPHEFGRLFGPADSDIAAVKAWLESHGLSVRAILPGRTAIEFSGTAGQLRSAFHTGIHRYEFNGESHFANTADPEIPAALAPLVAGLAALNNFQPHPDLKVLGRAEYNRKSGKVKPGWTTPAGSATSFYLLGPAAFATQYDLKPVYSAGTTGAGQRIAVISLSNIDLSLVTAYQTVLGGAAAPLSPQVVVDGNDPGVTDAAPETYLDVELAASIAPAAQVMLYTSASTALTNGLVTAAMRAVSDDLAGVLSISYSDCEIALGQGGNAFWNSLWQQAAAQGQTAFVAAGDSGSAGCDNADAQSAAYFGLAVNGIGSTPYNVSVGGTDFYYSQYAAGATALSAQMASYWMGGSAPANTLLQPIPEQAWNTFLGLNTSDQGNPANLGAPTVAAGGGGRSSAALHSGGPYGPASGYPKPIWQSGLGVPADKLRDLPDLSLFAGNGANGSFYPICANTGDCGSADSSGAVWITGAGGTSAASPAMAAIQALINQSTRRWQGQANYIYYPVASRQPSAFHDVVVGGSQVLCALTTLNCVPGRAGTPTGGYSIEAGYTTTRGYDMATGLGSVDVANLIKYWSTVTFRPSTTTLSISPATLVHGKAATVVVSVAPASGSGTPSGFVSLVGNAGLAGYAAIDSFPLVNGRVSVSVDNLPGGTYQVVAAYSGDNAFSPAKSLPVTVSVTPESDTLFTGVWALNPGDLYLYPLSPGMSIPYGAPVYLDVTPVSGNANLSSQGTPARGYVAFTDRGTTSAQIASVALGATGTAEWGAGVFTPGLHTVTAAYSGDPSYKPATATAATFTVTRGSTLLTVKPLVRSVSPGSAVSVDVELLTGFLPLHGQMPAGPVVVTLGGKAISTSWLPFGRSGNASLEAVVTFTNVPAGILPVTAAYGGDANWLSSSGNGGTVAAVSSRFTPTVNLAVSSSTPPPGQPVSLTATVLGPSGKPVPTGRVTIAKDNQAILDPVTLQGGNAQASAVVNLNASSLVNGNNIFTAVYSGDGAYNAGASTAVVVAVSRPEFSLIALTPALQIAAGKSAESSLVLSPVNGLCGPVPLSFIAPSGITISFTPAAPAVNSITNDLATLKVAATVAHGTYPVSIVATGCGHTHTTQIVIDVP